MSSALKKSPAGKDAADSHTRGGAWLSKSVHPLPLSRYVVFVAIAALGCAADLVTKAAVFDWLGLPAHFIERNPADLARWRGDASLDHCWWLWQQHVGIETSVNTGALFGMAPGFWWLFAALSVLALIGIFTWLFVFQAAHDRWLTVALASVTAGILGNLYDRLGIWDSLGLRPEFRHSVRDWILWRYSSEWTWPNFNLADSLLVTGAIMLVVHAFVWREAKQEAGVRGQESGAHR